MPIRILFQDENKSTLIDEGEINGKSRIFQIDFNHLNWANLKCSFGCPFIMMKALLLNLLLKVIFDSTFFSIYTSRRKNIARNKFSTQATKLGRSLIQFFLNFNKVVVFRLWQLPWSSEQVRR